MAKRKKRAVRKPGAQGPGLRYARNPGVSSLLLVNPAQPKPSKRDLEKALGPLVEKVVEKVGRKMPKTQSNRKRGRGKARPSPRQVALPFAHAAPAMPMVAVPALQPVAPRSRSPRRAAPAPARPKKGKRSPRTTPVAIDRAVEAALKKRFPAYQTRKRPYRGDPSSTRGLKALDRDRRSILWNLKNGPPKAREWVLDRVPRMNPGSWAPMALGIGAFFGNRFISNAASKLPGIRSAGTFAPVITSGLLTALAHFATKQRPDLRAPLVWGSAISLVDKVIEAAVLNFFPSAGKFLGMGAYEQHQTPSLEAFEEPMGYLPAYDPMKGAGMACYPGQAGLGMEVHEALADLGIDVHEAMADTGDGLGMEVHEALAGYVPAQGFAGYVPSSQPAIGDVDPSMGAYVPGYAGYVPTSGLGANDPMGNPIVAPTTQERMQDAAAFMFGGPLALAKLRGMRAMQQRRALAAQRRPMAMLRPPPAGGYPAAMMGTRSAVPGMGGGQQPIINVYCSHPHHRHHPHHGEHYQPSGEHYQHEGDHGPREWEHYQGAPQLMGRHQPLQRHIVGEPISAPPLPRVPMHALPEAQLVHPVPAAPVTVAAPPPAQIPPAKPIGMAGAGGIFSSD